MKHSIFLYVLSAIFLMVSSCATYQQTTLPEDTRPAVMIENTSRAEVMDRLMELTTEYGYTKNG